MYGGGIGGRGRRKSVNMRRRRVARRGSLRMRMENALSFSLNKNSEVGRRARTHKRDKDGGTHSAVRIEQQTRGGMLKRGAR